MTSPTDEFQTTLVEQQKILLDHGATQLINAVDGNTAMSTTVVSRIQRGICFEIAGNSYYMCCKTPIKKDISFLISLNVCIFKR